METAAAATPRRTVQAAALPAARESVSAESPARSVRTPETVVCRVRPSQLRRNRGNVAG